MRDSFLLFAPPSIGDEEIDNVVEVLRSGWLTTGPKCEELEQLFVDSLGVEAALAVNSATAALHLGLAAAGIGPGGAVFTTTLTFCSTVHIIEHLGATPILVDVEPDTLNIDPQALETAIKKAQRDLLVPKAVIPVHYGGHPCDMEAIFNLAQQHGLAVVEDAAHAMPSRYGGMLVGSPAPFGILGMAAFSFYATKNITTAEGGMLTGPKEVVDAARVLSLHGMSNDAWRRYERGGSWRYDVLTPGFKYNLSDVHAAIGIAQLQKLSRFASRRREIASTYTREFMQFPGIRTPTERVNMSSSWHLYPIQLEVDAFDISRDEFIEELRGHNIGTSVHFIPVHSLTYYRDRYRLSDDAFPVASAAFARLISLPIYPDMTDDDVNDVIAAVIHVAETASK